MSVQSQEAALAQAVDSVNAAANIFDGKGAIIDAKLAALQQDFDIKKNALDAQMAQYAQNSNITLEVGPGKQFATLQAAWDYLVGKQLRGSITIDLVDGVFQQEGIYLANQPAACFVRIIGNEAAPANCVLQFTNDAATGKSNGLNIRNASGLYLSGLTLNVVDRANNRQALFIGQNSSVYTATGGLIINNALLGAAVYDLSQLVSWGLKTTNCLAGVFATENSTVDIRNAVISGAGRAVNGIASGICAFRGANIHCYGAVVSGHGNGYWASGGGRIFAQVSQAATCAIGYLADANGYIWATVADTAANTTRAWALDCDVGFNAWSCGFIDAANARAENARQGFACGFRGYMNAWGARAINCTQYGFYAEFCSAMDATNTNANLSGTPTGYNLANVTFGNDGAFMRRS